MPRICVNIMKGQNGMMYILLYSEQSYIQQAHIMRPIDDSLIVSIAKGNMDALHTLYELSHKSIYGYALSIVKNTHDADDILQETVIKVYEKATEYTPMGKPLAWIFTICKNLANDKLRQKNKASDFDETRPETPDLSIISNIENRLLMEELFKILTDEEKQVLILHAVSGLKHKEIAGVLGLSLGTVLSKYHRAIKKLKEKLKEETQ